MSDEQHGRAERLLPPVALSETCRVIGGRIPLWGFHRERLAAGGCGPAVLAQAENAAIEAASEWTGTPGTRVRLSVTVAPSGDVSVGVAQRLSSLDVPGGPIPVRVDVAGLPVLPPGAAKPADRDWWADTQRRARARDGHQAIIVGRQDRVIDGGTATVWLAEGTQLVTPPAPPAVAGVARAFLLDAAPEHNIRVFVEPVPWSRVETADELFFTNAFAGAVAARDRGGFVFNAVAEIFEQVWRSAE